MVIDVVIRLHTFMFTRLFKKDKDKLPIVRKNSLILSALVVLL